MWWKNVLKFFNPFSSGSQKSPIEQIGELSLDIREAFKGKEADPNLLLEYSLKVMQIKASIIANDQNGNWIQRSWRPLFSLMLVFILFNNTVLITYFDFAREIDLIETLPYMDKVLYAIGVLYGVREVGKKVKGNAVVKTFNNVLNNDKK